MTTPLPRRARAIVVLALLLAALAAPLGACGKKGAPSPPAGEPNTYPRSYPRE
jgi:predicted small lipoprotein YifL